MSCNLFSIEQDMEGGIPGIKVTIDERIVGLDGNDRPKGIKSRNLKWQIAAGSLVFVMALLQVLFLGLSALHCFESVRMSVQFSKYVTASWSHDAWPLVALCMSSLFSAVFVLWMLCRQANRAAKREMDMLEFRVESWKTIIEKALIKHEVLIYPSSPNDKCRITIGEVKDTTSDN